MKFIKSHKIITISASIIFIVIVSFIIIFIKNREFFNYKEIIYKRSSVCQTDEAISSKAYDKRLSEIIGTTKYDEKLFVLNNYNIKNISFKTYKNSPAKTGDCKVMIKYCSENSIKTFEGRYEKLGKYVVLSLLDEVIVLYYDEKTNVLIDYNSYLQNSKEKFYLE